MIALGAVAGCGGGSDTGDGAADTSTADHVTTDVQSNDAAADVPVTMDVPVVNDVPVGTDVPAGDDVPTADDVHHDDVPATSDALTTDGGGLGAVCSNTNPCASGFRCIGTATAGRCHVASPIGGPCGGGTELAPVCEAGSHCVLPDSGAIGGGGMCVAGGG